MLESILKNTFASGKGYAKDLMSILVAAAMSLTLSYCSSTKSAEATLQEQIPKCTSTEQVEHALEAKASKAPEASKTEASAAEAKVTDDEMTYVITLPLEDNSGNEIKQAVYDNFMIRLSDYFGGVSTQPIVYGCWHDTERKKLVCEPNAVFSSSRDCNDKAALKEKFGTDDCSEIAQRYDRPFVNAIAKEYGIMLGQSTVYVQENAAVISFVEGQRKETLPNELVRSKECSCVSYGDFGEACELK